MGCTKPNSSHDYCDAQNLASLKAVADKDKEDNKNLGYGIINSPYMPAPKQLNQTGVAK
jgi:hypothetical protein